MSTPTTDAPRCTFHTDRTTYRSCSRCSEPYCHDCLVDAAVGAQCLTCVAEGRGYQKIIDPNREATVGELTSRVKPSPVFLAVVGAFLASVAWAFTTGDDGNGGRWALRATVLTGWILSLCLHEFGHASVAYLGGDRSVASKGYLTLDPRKYANGVTSIALPLLFLVMGGIGLPGGAVYTQTGRIKTLGMRSAMSLAGPGANILCGLIFGLLFKVIPDGHTVLSASFAFLALLQMFAAVLNLLPIPGLDGFGALNPYLPENIQQAAVQVSRYAFFILFLLVFRVPALSDALWNAADFMIRLVQVPTNYAIAGQRAFQFTSL